MMVFRLNAASKTFELPTVPYGSLEEMLMLLTCWRHWFIQYENYKNCP